MFQKITRSALLMILVFTLSGFAGQPSADSAVLGRNAPDFTLQDLDGNKHSLSDFQGKFVVLEWINHDCPFVKKHYGTSNMQNLQKEFTSKGVVWLSINSSAPGKQGNFSPDQWKSLTAEKGAAPTAILLDPKGNVGRAYDAKTTPHMYVINPEGVLVYRGAIDSIPSTDRADVPRAKNYLKQALNEAMSGNKVSEPSTQPYGCSVKY